MIRKVRRRFALIAMGAFVFVVAGILLTINILMIRDSDRRADTLLQTLIDNGSIPEMQPHPERPGQPGKNGFTAETRFETRYFLARTDKDGQILMLDTGHIAAVDSQSAMEMAQEVLDSGRREGYCGIYKFRVEHQEQGKLLVFLDCHRELEMRRDVLIISLLVALASLAVILVLVYVLSGVALRPVADSIRRQKNFITDAGHELKTPLAIISANTDVLALTQPESEWIGSIKNQINRLNKLVQDMLLLSRLEETVDRREFRELELSTLVEETAEPFRVLAERFDKQLLLEIEPRLRIRGDERQLQTLVNVLMDNAVKYAPRQGRIRVRLYGRDNRVCLEVFNHVEQLPKGDPEQLFDRFYRADSARGRKQGGFGIGLSIAKAAAESHRARIGCCAVGEKEILFFVEFSNKL